ncbi:unnamed protein product [Timema podura]|uniref:trypsin n=1 Tax=Timema podura TaxID=61482 RepID=A0ABN7NNP1_TIMPD|nr:unnamed protein product [Timema podura]
MDYVITFIHIIILYYVFNSKTATSARFSARRSMKDKTARIVGGEPTTITMYPHQLSVANKNNHNCGATLISPVWVLSAAHCFTKHSLTHLTLRGGSTTLKSTSAKEPPAEVRNIIQIIKHTSFNQLDYDIALLKVNAPFDLNTRVKVANLPAAGFELQPGTLVTVTGWGATMENGTASDVLRKVNLNVISYEECEQALSPIPINKDTMLCAGNLKGGKDACQGDSGGPLVSNNVLVGVVSWGLGCAREGNTGVFTKVSHFRSWITEHTGV